MRKITILGMGPSAKIRQVDMANHVIGEVWGLNNGYNTYPDLMFSRWFELHRYTDLVEEYKGQQHFHRIENLHTPCYRLEPLPIIEAQVKYDIVEVFKHFKTNYFLGSPSLMLALALYEHDHGQEIEEIRSWGLDFSDELHAQQKQSWTFWMSKVIDRGIKVSGTAGDFVGEEDNDVGLRGIKENVGKIIMGVV